MGKWICEAIGHTDSEEEFKTEQEALDNLKKILYEDEEYSKDISYDLCDIDTHSVQLGDEEYYQAIFVYEKPKTTEQIISNKIQSIHTQVTRYAYELETTEYITEELNNLEQIILNALKK